MFGAAPFLYMGRDRIQNKFGSDLDYEDENESFQKMLNLANDVQADMVHGVIEILNLEHCIAVRRNVLHSACITVTIISDECGFPI